MSALLGTSLSGRYRLDARVGSGGMSTVYEAFDTVLARPVAIKLMNREIAHDSAQLERFRREARAVAQLSHPHIVTVIDYGEDAGRPYIVFEFVRGETLKQRIRRLGRLPVPEAVAYALEIARALGCAHSHHIVHRDVKPQNVLIDEEGSAKVTDFGIARSLDEEGLTADGRVLGTTDYVSPEQAMGRPVSGRSDIYALGIVLWEMLVGDIPFRGENQVAVAMKHVREPLPDVQQLRPDVSATLAAVVDRMTAKDPAQRYGSTDDLTADLEEVLALETARAGGATGEATAVLRTISPSAQRRVPLWLRHPRIGAALALAAVAGTVVALVLLGDNAHHGTGTLDQAPPLKAQPVELSTDAAHDFDPYGTGGEHGYQAALAVDSDRGTYWTTETYDGGQLGKPGVGIYVDAHPGVRAKFLRVATPTPGFAATIYVRDDPPGANPTSLAGWRPVAKVDRMGRDQSIALDGSRERFYLLWIRSLPPGADQVKIAELTLFR